MTGDGRSEQVKKNTKKANEKIREQREGERKEGAIK